jgi:nucleotide-binding universal stress UspA family protein
VTKEEIMSTTKPSLQRPCVVCHVDATATAAPIVEAAATYCRQRDAELIVVWALDPSSFRPSLPPPAGDAGIWGLPGAVAVAVELARRHGITAQAVVRFGDADRVLEEERRAARAERVFTRADVLLEPAIHLRSKPVKLESDAA